MELERLHDGLLAQLQNYNLSQEELGIAAQALSHCRYDRENRFAIAEAERCGTNILEIIGGIMLAVEGIDVCAAYCVQPDGVRFSVCSCTKTTRANELADYLANGPGSGHSQKAEGFLVGKWSSAESEASGSDGPLASQYLWERLNRYFQEQDIFYAGTDQVPDLSQEPLYRKNRLPAGYVKAAELYPVGTEVSVRMLEGDISFTVKEDTYFMIGIEGEVYQNSEAYFLTHNDPTEEPYQFHGKYAPMAQEAVRATDAPQLEGPINLAAAAKTCLPKESPLIHARQLTRRTKIFVSWSEDYMLGKPGDWLVARAEDLKNVYIVEPNIFQKSYRPQDIQPL